MGASIIPILASIIGGSIPLIAGAVSGGPNYPSTPSLARLPVGRAQNFMEGYEQNRMDASIAAWRQRYPLLGQGEDFLINDIARNQGGQLSTNVQNMLQRSGLETPTGTTNEYQLSTQLGLSPEVLSQRTSMAVNREMALNPMWSKDIPGGTLATMLMNANANQNAFTSALSSIQNAQRIGQMNFNTQALVAGVTGLTGAAGIGAQIYGNQAQQAWLSRFQQGQAYGYTPANLGYGPGYGYGSQTITPGDQYSGGGFGGMGGMGNYSPIYGGGGNYLGSSMYGNTYYPFGFGQGY